MGGEEKDFLFLGVFLRVWPALDIEGYLRRGSGTGPLVFGELDLHGGDCGFICSGRDTIERAYRAGICNNTRILL